MPLTAKGEKILAALIEEYGSEEKAKEVLYAGKNKGTFTGIDNMPSEENPRDNTWPVSGETQTLQIDVYRSGRVRVRSR